MPPKVVYSLTQAGKNLKFVLDEMHKWGIDYVQEFGKVTDENLCQSNICN